jgi:hypothetical protein
MEVAAASKLSGENVQSRFFEALMKMPWGGETTAPPSSIN